MARILFRMLPQTGHHNATYSLATELKKSGHVIVYAANKNLQQAVEENGFEFVEIKEADDISVFNVIHKNTQFGFLSFLRRVIARHRRTREQTNRISRVNFFKNIVRQVQPDLIMIDAFLNPYALQIYRYKIPFISIQILVSTIRTDEKPPLDSPFIPRKSFYSKIVTWFCWQLHYLRTLDRVSPVKGVSLLAKEVGFPLTEVNFKNYRSIGFRSIPEINTSPLEFDYPHRKENHHYYFKNQLDLKRTDTLTDYSFQEVYEKLRSSPLKVVYCSFGSLSLRYWGHQRFLKKLVKAFKEWQYHLILCAEDDRLRRELRSSSSTDKIHIFKRVPQIVLLNEIADVMINHGGINSILECIYTNTPMLVYPGSTYYDQIGNAARAKYHGIGLRGTYGDSVKSAARKR